ARETALYVGLTLTVVIALSAFFFGPWFSLQSNLSFREGSTESTKYFTQYVYPRLAHLAVRRISAEDHSSIKDEDITIRFETKSEIIDQIVKDHELKEVEKQEYRSGGGHIRLKIEQQLSDGWLKATFGRY